MSDKSLSTIGSSILQGGSSWLCHSYIATQGLTKIVKSTFALDKFCRSLNGVSLPHTAHPDSAIISGDISSHALEIIMCCSLRSGGDGGNSVILFKFLYFIMTSGCAFLCFLLSFLLLFS